MKPQSCYYMLWVTRWHTQFLRPSTLGLAPCPAAPWKAKGKPEQKLTILLHSIHLQKAIIHVCAFSYRQHLAYLYSRKNGKRSFLCLFCRFFISSYSWGSSNLLSYILGRKIYFKCRLDRKIYQMYDCTWCLNFSTKESVWRLL